MHFRLEIVKGLFSRRVSPEDKAKWAEPSAERHPALLLLRVLTLVVPMLVLVWAFRPLPAPSPAEDVKQMEQLEQMRSRALPPSPEVQARPLGWATVRRAAYACQAPADLQRLQSEEPAQDRALFLDGVVKSGDCVRLFSRERVRVLRTVDGLLEIQKADSIQDRYFLPLEAVKF